ncbi:helix-turn-helix domain-containing protein [Brenneria populi]|uniref:Helix-turn-helix domain-containing protein n=1 Tax=Brenneria populi TaxID=1505588 RepID=A0ABU6JLS9_9GAMM|nr:helix-turn-helix domain-containing protein [Brenneria populi Li et al. 2015]
MRPSWWLRKEKPRRRRKIFSTRRGNGCAITRTRPEPRPLQRHFHHVTGVPLMRWLALRRLEHAKELLRSAHYPIEKVAELSGHASEAMLRRQFRLYEHCSPSQYRKMNHSDR